MRALVASVVAVLVSCAPVVAGLLSRVSVAGPTSAEVPIRDSFVGISADGRYVAFTTNASITPGGGGYLLDRRTGTYELVTVATDGTPGGGGVIAMSADASVVVFGSIDPVLAGAPVGNNFQLYVRDRVAGTTTRITAGPGNVPGNGTSQDVSMSADGRFVAYVSGADNLVPGDTNGKDDVFVYDRTTGATSRASVDTMGNQANNHSIYTAISADGRYVAFFSYADLVPGDATTPGDGDIFVRDTVAGTTTCVSVDSSGTPVGATGAPTISPNGRFVAFYHSLWDRTTGLVTDIGSYSAYAVLDDGQRLLVSGAGYYLALLDRATSTTQPVSVSSRGHQGTLRNYPFRYGVDSPAITPDGRYVAFASDLIGLDASDLSGGIFVTDLAPTCGNGVLDLGEQCDDGNLIDGDGCESTCELTPCAGGTTITKALVRRRLNSKGDENVSITGKLGFPSGVPATVDLPTDGFQVMLEDLGHQYSTLAFRDPGTIVPGGAYPTAGCSTFNTFDGWTTRSGGLVQTYVNHTRGLPPFCVADGRAPTKVTIKDQRARANAIVFTVKLKRGHLQDIPDPAIGPYRVTVVLGDRTASAGGACGTHTFAASECFITGAQVITCKSP